MVTLTGVGFYIVIIYVFGIASSLYFAGEGKVIHTRGVLLFSAAWSTVNLILLLTVGFNV